ncbi:MAG: 4-hydroxy-tetrahydrodipicolinate synthase [Ruminococcaceae bacterium]|nr:4-hydroxy-tetrahydrodipicolinate synthase [Oscillospiraceae bacterium]
MSKKTLFTGSGVALVTPFNESGVDFDALGKLIDFQIEHKTDAIIICGTTGEASTMPDAEHIETIRYTVERTAGRVPVIAGTGSNDTAHGVQLAKKAQQAGADGLLLVTPYYNKTTQRGLIQHYSAIAAGVDLPIILYNVPSRTGLGIDVQTVKTLSANEQFIGVKDATGNISYTAQLAAACPDVDIYSGNDDMILPVMSLGGKGVISVLANVMPEETHDMCEKYTNGDLAGALKLQLDLLDLIGALFCEVNPIPAKTALNLMGFNAGKLRLPLYEMSDANLETLKKALKAHGLI